MRQYTIAGHTIQIRGKGLSSLPGFDSFSSEKPNDELLLIIEPEADSTALDWDIPPCFTSEFEQTSYDLSAGNDAYLFRMRQSEAGCLSAGICRENNRYRAMVSHTDTFGEQTLKFVCWLLFGIAGLSRQTVSIHSSAVTVRGKTVLFLGESGT